MPALSNTTRTRGLHEFLVAADHAERASKKLVRDELRAAAEPVREEAQRLLAELSPRTKDTRYGISVRRVGTVTVERRRRKTTGKRPDWGWIQMRDALMPAAETKQGEVQSRLEASLDELADQFERRP